MATTANQSLSFSFTFILSLVPLCLSSTTRALSTNTTTGKNSIAELRRSFVSVIFDEMRRKLDTNFQLRNEKLVYFCWFWFGIVNSITILKGKSWNCFLFHCIASNNNVSHQFGFISLKTVRYHKRKAFIYQKIMWLKMNTKLSVKTVSLSYKMIIKKTYFALFRLSF